MSNTPIKKGSLYLYDFGPYVGSKQGGLRPAITLTESSSSPTVIIAPITKVLKKTDMAAHVVLGKRFNLREKSQVLLEQLQTVNKASLGPYIGQVDVQTLKAIDLGICKTLGIQSLPVNATNSAQEVSK